MPVLKVVTWNCDPGESLLKWNDLKAVIDWHDNNTAHPVDVVAVQEANAHPGGHIHNAFATTLAGAYPSGVGFHAPLHTRELPGAGRGYIVAARTNLANVGALTRYNYGGDGDITHIQNGLHGITRNRWIAAKGMRPPVTVSFTLGHGGDQVLFATWHAPRGIGMLFGIADTYTGGAHPDAVCVLDRSRLLQTNRLAAWGHDVLVFAGDINMVDNDFNGTANGQTTPDLDAADRVGHHLDHIFTIQGASGNAPVTQNGLNSTSVSAHEVVSAEVAW